MRLVELAEDEEILATVPPDGLVAVDAPLDVPNEAGNRDLERIIAWCDVPLFPVAGARLDRVVGGRRGATLAPALRAATRRVIEASPELILREILFERGLAPGAPPLDLADYRSRWLSIRPPAYRPKGGGRARPAGLEPAAEALGTVLDLDGLELTPAPRDLEAIADAARLDAVACAFAAHRALAEPERAVLLGAHQRGEMLIPADTNLRNRLAVNLTRMTASGEVHPETRLSDARF